MDFKIFTFHDGIVIRNYRKRAFVKVVITSEIFKARCIEARLHGREGWKIIVRVPGQFQILGHASERLEDRKLQTDYNFGECRPGTGKKEPVCSFLLFAI